MFSHHCFNCANNPLPFPRLEIIPTLNGLFSDLRRFIEERLRKILVASQFLQLYDSTEYEEI